MEKYNLKILGIDCPNCASKLERALTSSKLLKDVSLSFVTSTLTFSLDDEVMYEKAIKEINNIINKVEPEAYLEISTKKKRSNSNHYGHQHNDSSNNSKQVHRDYHKIVNISIMFLSIVLLLAGTIISKTIERPWSFNPISITLYIMSYLLMSYDILYKSIKNILRGQVFDEKFLMSIASVGAMFLKEFHEAILVILLYKLGEIFQDYAINNSHKSIKTLLELQPKTANLLKGNKIVEVPTEYVRVNDIVVVKPGEKVPLDGFIVEGISSFDTSGITGESRPIDLEVKDEVSSGYINLSSLIKIKVSKKFEDSNVSKMLKLIEESQSKKSNNEKFITKFAKYYTPVVVILSLLLISVPSIIHSFFPNIIKDSFDIWLYRGLVFLVISCPCALVISVPLAFFGGVGRCSKSGILVKGSNYLERMAKVDTILFDKTGTITKGNFVINKIISSNYDEETILKYAYLCDYYSNHPIACAIKNRAGDLNVDISMIGESINLSGLGVKTNINNKIALVGNEKLMKEFNIIYNKINEIGTIVYVAYDNKFLGALVIKDELKDNIKNEIIKFNAQGINTIMLSGDNFEIVKEVSGLVGIKEYKANLSPIDKVDELKKISNNKKEKHNIVFIGDGINDAPSLINADVGISMGGLGSDVAIESSDIVINDDSISKVNELIKVSRGTVKIVKENIIFSIGVKMLIMLLTTFGITNMLLGIFADVGVMILAVLNSIRILTIKK